MKKQIEGQISIFDYLAEKNKVCQFSQHTCNKTELWKVAHTFDDFTCPETCCRNCDIRCCGARCNGSEEPKEKITRWTSWESVMMHIVQSARSAWMSSDIWTVTDVHGVA